MPRVTAFTPGGGPQLAHGDGILINGSFESGDFTGWTAVDIGSPWHPWAVAGAGSGPWPFVPRQPQDGAFVAWNGFDGAGPGSFSLWQDVDLPEACQLELDWDDRFQWDFTVGAPTTLPREAFVQLWDPVTNSVIETLDYFSTGTQSENPTGDTGWRSNTADMSPYAGMSVRLAFRLDVPEAFTGPGQFELDHVAIRAVGGEAVATAALVPVGDKSVKSKKGLFEVQFSCEGDDCGSGGGVEMTLDGTFASAAVDEAPALALLNGIPVENGQIVDLRLKSEKSNKSDKSDKSDKSEKSEKSSKSGKSEKPLKIEGPSFELVVICENGATATASPVFAEKSEKSKKSNKGGGAS